MPMNYKASRYNTPSTYTQLMDSRESHEKTQKVLLAMTAERDALKAKVHELYTEVERLSRELARG